MLHSHTLGLLLHCAEQKPTDSTEPIRSVLHVLIRPQITIQLSSRKTRPRFEAKAPTRN